MNKRMVRKAAKRMGFDYSPITAHVSFEQVYRMWQKEQRRANSR